MNRNKVLIILMTFLMMIVSYSLLSQATTYHTACIEGTICIAIVSALMIMGQKEKIIPFNIIYVFFVLFQFGLPILNALDGNYYSFYINQFDEGSLIESVRNTAISIEFFALGAMIVGGKEYSNKTIKNSVFSDNNSNNIESIFTVIFTITSIVAIPLAIYVAYLASIHGYNYVKEDTMRIYNGLTRVCQQLFVPSTVLVIIFTESKKKKKAFLIISILYATILIFTGGRTTSIGIIIMDLFIFLSEFFKEKTNRILFFKIIAIIVIIAVGFLGVTVIQIRSGVNSSKGIVGIMETAIAEMGFNFTSICFTRLYIPNVENYKMGFSYFASLVCLIPKSIDFTGTINNIYVNLPELWLANKLHTSFDSLYDFGVGYSVIAEAYYNFGAFGFLGVFVQSLIINFFMNKDYSNSTDKKFRKYIQMILLFELITYPRRSFYTLLKSIEYDIWLVMLIIFFYSSYKYTVKERNNIIKKE